MAQYWTWVGWDEPGQAKSTVSSRRPRASQRQRPGRLRGGGRRVAPAGPKFALPVSAYIGETYLEKPAVPDDDPASIPEEFFTTERVLVTLDG